MRKSRLAAGLAASLGLSALISVPMAAPAHAVDCADPIEVNLLSFTDFHGRITDPYANPDTAVYFSTLEQNRDVNTLVISNGDAIGASLFPSMIDRDQPTVDILNALDLAASSVGNHELDGGYADFTDRVMDASTFPYVSANLVTNDGAPVADAEYVIENINGVDVAIIGAITEDLPSLVAPSVFDQTQVTSAVTAVNTLADQLKADNTADIVVVAFHEGTFANAGFGPNVDMVINGHTHTTFASPLEAQPAVIQPGNYASHIGKTTLLVDVDDETVCSVPVNENITAPRFTEAQAAERDAYIAAGGDRSVAINGIVTEALANAEVLGAPVIAEATAPISRGLRADGTTLDNRGIESTMSNLVAQMFYDVLGAGDPNFIGVQNPGGTRADFDAGDISYGEAAAVLPFANTLMTTQLTGAQIKLMLEQQWQPDPTSNRPYLALGLSDNVSYTYDESRPANDRILNVFVNGTPIDPAALYTVGSGSFLIGGGDNFTVIGEGVNTADTGRADLEAWVEWLHSKDTVSPDYSKRGVAFEGTNELTVGTPVQWTIGQPIDGALNTQTLDMASLGAPAATVLNAYHGSPTGPSAGTVSVVDGVATLSLNLPAGTAGGPAFIYLVSDTGTVAIIPVNITAPVVPPSTPPSSPAPVDKDKMKGAPLPRTGVAG